MSVGWMALIPVAVSAVVSVPCAVAQLPVPVGPELQVNTYTTGSQGSAAVAADGTGSFVVVWDSNGGAGSDTSSLSIQGQRYDSTGTLQGPQFQVNTYTTGLQRFPAVAADGAGNFVVVWESNGSAGPDTSGYSIQGQRYDSAGTPQGGEFGVNSYTTGTQRAPAVATDDSGSFVVVWQSAGSSGSDSGSVSIQGQRYDSAGTPLGGEFQVNTYTTNNQDGPALATDGAGNFVVVWESEGSFGPDTSSESVQGQRYDSTGTPLGGEFQVNTYTTGGQNEPAVASDSAGNFLVVWMSLGSGGSDTSARSIQGRRYDGAGTPQEADFQVNAFTTGGQYAPAVTADVAANFVVVWESDVSAGSDTSDLSVQARRYDGAGTPQGSEFQVNTYTTGVQGLSAVASVGGSNLVVVWESDVSAGSDTSPRSVQGQQFALPTTTSTTLPTTDLLPGRIAIIRPGKLTKFVAKSIDGDPFTLPTGDPVAVGGSLRVFDFGTTAGSDTYLLPAGTSWRGLGKPAGSKGYRYEGAGTSSDPCRVVLVKASVIKGVCRGAGITLTPPFTGDVGIALTVGTTDRYCARFGGKSVKNGATLTKRKKAAAPGSCPP